MPTATSNLLNQYVELLCQIYGKHLKTVILYGSYARGDYRDDSDIDIMVLLDLEEMDIKKYRLYYTQKVSFRMDEARF